jgi:hypothetical protein
LIKTGGSEEDLQNRISKAQFAFKNLNAKWKSAIYSLKTKLKHYGAIVKSTLMHGNECWTMTKKAEKKLRVFQQKCLRRILRVFYPNLVRNEDILRRTKQTNIIEELMDRKWRWVGRMAQKEPGLITRQAFGFRVATEREEEARPTKTDMDADHRGRMHEDLAGKFPRSSEKSKDRGE